MLTPVRAYYGRGRNMPEKLKMRGTLRRVKPVL